MSGFEKRCRDGIGRTSQVLRGRGGGPDSEGWWLSHGCGGTSSIRGGEHIALLCGAPSFPAPYLRLPSACLGELCLTCLGPGLWHDSGGEAPGRREEGLLCGQPLAGHLLGGLGEGGRRGICFFKEKGVREEGKEGFTSLEREGSRVAGDQVRGTEGRGILGRSA